MGTAQENVFTALGDRVTRIMCTLKAEGATPGTHLTRGRSSCGNSASVFGPGPFDEKMPVQTNINIQIKQQQHRHISAESSEQKKDSSTLLFTGEPVKEKAVSLLPRVRLPRGLSCYLSNEKQAL